MKGTPFIEIAREVREVLMRYYEVMEKFGEKVASLVSEALNNKFEIRYVVGGIQWGGVEFQEDPHVIGIYMEDTWEERRRQKNHKKYCIDIYDAIEQVYPEFPMNIVYIKGSFKLSREEAERLKKILQTNQDDR